MSTAVEFGSKAVADSFREKHGEHLCSDDDRRRKTVIFSSDAPEAVVEDAQLAADDERAEHEVGPGQSVLSDSERDRIDFSKGQASVPHARSVKAIARTEGVDDWLSYYDPYLTVDEHREVMEQAAREDRGRRFDEEDSAVERAGRASRTAQSEECDHARGHCRHGDPDACEFLRERCGFDESEVEEILAGRDGADAGPDEIEGEALGALKRAWQGYKGAIAQVEQSIGEYLEPEWNNAQQAAKAINSIRQQHGQEPIHFDRLEEIQAELLDFTRMMAADCHECHADHSGHAHTVESGDVEDLPEAVFEGTSETPVGTSQS